MQDRLESLAAVLIHKVETFELHDEIDCHLRVCHGLYNLSLLIDC